MTRGARLIIALSVSVCVLTVAHAGYGLYRSQEDTVSLILDGIVIICTIGIVFETWRRSRQ